MAKPPKKPARSRATKSNTKAAKSTAITATQEEEEQDDFTDVALSGSPQTRYRKRLLLRALEKTASIVAPACKMTGVNRVTFYEWCQTDPAFKKAFEELQIVKKDMFEYLVVQSAIAGDTRSRIELNKKLNRDRGYGDKLDIGVGFNASMQNKKVWIPRNGRDNKERILSQAVLDITPVPDTVPGTDVRPVVQAAS